MKIFVMVVGIVAPIFSGIIYTYFQGVPLIVGAIILNIVILIILATKDIDPKVDIDELEKELRGTQADDIGPEMKSE